MPRDKVRGRVAQAQGKEKSQHPRRMCERGLVRNVVSGFPLKNSKGLCGLDFCGSCDLDHTRNYLSIVQNPLTVGHKEENWYMRQLLHEELRGVTLTDRR